MPQDLPQLHALFKACARPIAAVGDPTRQAIVLALMEGPCEGMRVGAITQKVNLSAPAVSHHLKILCDAGILAVEKQGTMNFYHLNPDRTAITNIQALCQGILDGIGQCEARRHGRGAGA